MKALVIEDNPEIVQAIALAFELRWPGTGLISATEGGRGLQLVQEESPDMVILDLGLPDMDGFEVLGKLRGFSNVPVIILTVRGEETSKVEGLRLGADDYVVKPFSPGEFLARVGAVLRRRDLQPGTPAEGASFSGGKLKMDSTTWEVSLGGKAARLSPSEYTLLYHLARNEGKTLSSETLRREVWGPGYTANLGYVRVHIQQLREKLEQNPGNPRVIVGDEKTGYKFIGQ